VIITTGQIRRTLINKINLLVDSPRSIRASHLAPIKAEAIFLRHASGCFGTSRSLSLTTSTTPRIRVPRHVARLVTRLVASLVVDYSASRSLVVDYFASAARPGASARRAARHAARRRLLRLRRASRCLGMSRGSSRGSLSTTSTTTCVLVPQHVARLVAPLVVDYFAYAARLGASARRAARHTAHRRLLQLRRASGCLGTSRHSSLTTSTTPRVQVPRHVARLVAPLVVDFFAYAARLDASARRAACRRLLRLAQDRRRLLRLRLVSGCLGTSRGSSRRSPSTTSPTPCILVPRHIMRLVTRLVVDRFVRCDFILWPHWLYFNHAVCRDYLSH
jgi:hypothetical protein